MTLDPILNATPTIQLHTAMALLAMALTVGIFTLPRGTRLHKILGRVWATAMAVVALSSFWIFELQLVGKYSPIHLLSIYTLVNLYVAVRAARAGNITLHQRSMKGLVFGALVVAGAFTFLPGRTMYQVFLGG